MMLEKKKPPTPTPLISWNGADRRRCRPQLPIQPRDVTNVRNALIAVGRMLQNRQIVGLHPGAADIHRLIASMLADAPGCIPTSLRC